MKPILCDPCPEETAALYLLQDVSTGESQAFCPDHFAMYCMGMAEAWAQAQISQEDSKSDEQREVYDDPGPDPLITEREVTEAEQGSESGVPIGGEDTRERAET